MMMIARRNESSGSIRLSILERQAGVVEGGYSSAPSMEVAAESLKSSGISMSRMWKPDLTGGGVPSRCIGRCCHRPERTEYGRPIHDLMLTWLERDRPQH